MLARLSVLLALVATLASRAQCQAWHISVRNTGTTTINAVVAYKESTLFRTEWKVSGYFPIGPGKKEYLVTSEHAVFGFVNGDGEQILFKIPDDEVDEKLPVQLKTLPVHPKNGFGYALKQAPRGEPDYADLEMSFGIRALGDAGERGWYTFEIEYNGRKGLPLRTNRQIAEDRAKAAQRRENAARTRAVLEAVAAARLFERGLKEFGGISVDADSNAFHLLEQSAAKGFAPAQELVGWMCEQGRGTERDDRKAVEWYRRSEAAGRAYGTFRLGMMYARGRGVDEKSAAKRDARAVELFSKASERGCAAADDWAGWMTEQHRPATLPEPMLDIALQNYEQAAQRGRSFGALRRAIMYLEGVGTTADERKAYSLMKDLAEQGHAPAMFFLAQLYNSGRGVEVNKLQAQRWQAASVAKATSRDLLSAATVPPVDDAPPGIAISPEGTILVQPEASLVGTWVLEKTLTAESLRKLGGSAEEIAALLSELELVLAIRSDGTSIMRTTHGGGDEQVTMRWAIDGNRLNFLDTGSNDASTTAGVLGDAVLVLEEDFGIKLHFARQ